MKARSFLIVFFLMITAVVVQAQEDKSGKKGDEPLGMGMKSNMESCMDQIAADKSLRTQMMTRMMDNMKNDTTAMREMCATMMKNPQMHSMIMKMMSSGGMGSGMGKAMDRGDMRKQADSSMRIQQP